MTEFPAVVAIGLNVVIALLILIIGWWLSAVAGRAIKRMAASSPRVDPTIVPMAQSVTVWTIRIFVLIAVLARFGVQTASIIAVLGAAGLAVGLALQNTLQNIAAGIMLLMLRPLRAGEFVSVVGKGDGTVQEVGLFLTRFEQVDGIQFTLPNSLIWGNPIINYSRNTTRRLDFGVGVRYGDDLDLALKLLQNLLDENDKVLKDPAPQVMVMEYKDSVITVNLRAWISAADFWDTRFHLFRRAIQVLNEAGLQTPVPVREIVQSGGDKKAA
ncbi:mechanosensitive ion channel [Alcaligenes ammonioxydans]|uniref:Small-conductance mechanosensitive channel n=1 Tax=Alcaligenes ammonioxydans TaxID=2582914 RepID=A0ABX8SX89_9BURK|nr:mechanosensitive ion channel domain-containing protein [Alcaligenes ammonioxydans]QBH21442.1 mechanosensitive ion channel [Alcaligenes faecalis]HRL22412.1 mechanosensitive ion channel [Alcaligenes sp.]MCH1879523.1 mechanosensitive ion channel [Alcaligenes ammonioxydans]QXX80655.1 mechanosensitive ion channel [Alcaligenes ammonioxydans]WGQ37211.1 mechanosensitive ion channel [Alcaligenes faecalis]